MQRVPTIYIYSFIHLIYSFTSPYAQHKKTPVSGWVGPVWNKMNSPEIIRLSSLSCLTLVTSRSERNHLCGKNEENTVFFWLFWSEMTTTAELQITNASRHFTWTKSDTQVLPYTQSPDNAFQRKQCEYLFIYMNRLSDVMQRKSYTSSISMSSSSSADSSR